MELISKQKARDLLIKKALEYGESFSALAYWEAANLIKDMDNEIITDNRVKYIAEHYGLPAQREQLEEECAELILASQKCKRIGDKNTFNNFCEEVADVYIMVMQMMHLISPELISEIIDKKLTRQMKRIKEEMKDEEP